ncbi:MAG: peptidylprolyl isomerase [Victivallales bacterium]|nr:peptidylprolyl isomerase [Victivallales bacterium]
MTRICEGQIFEQFQEKILAEVEKPEPVTEEEAKKFYDENLDHMRTPALLSAAHILVLFPSQSPTDDEKAETLKKAQEIRATLAEDGSNFAEVAAEKSDCPSKQNGGDLGQFPKGTMVPEFEEALVKLQEGEISDPVETIFGYHLIKAGASEPEKLTPYEEIKDEIINYLTNSKQEEAQQNALEALLDKLMKEADIKILLPEPNFEDEGEESAEEAAPADAE